ncbi:MAG: alpha/beta fold hydrolase [Acetobacteraceae bacterium]|nr:alpha/beta fold hydrolase [Acetobacteraceae bacterium]
MPAIDLGRIALHYTDTGVAHNGVGGPPILLIHELGGSGDSFAALAAQLSPYRRVIAPDLRSAGRSEKPPVPFSMDDCAQDLIALLAEMNVAQCDVLGAALGSFIAFRMALRQPALVRRMTLCAAAIGISEGTATYIGERAARVRAQGMRVAVDTSLENAFPTPHEAIRAVYRPLWIANDPAGYAELSLALGRERTSVADWGKLTCPVLVTNGAADFIWPPKAGQEVAAAIPGARYETLHRAGHFPHLQAPADLAALVLEFFS